MNISALPAEPFRAHDYFIQDGRLKKRPKGVDLEAWQQFQKRNRLDGVIRLRSEHDAKRRERRSIKPAPLLSAEPQQPEPPKPETKPNETSEQEKHWTYVDRVAALVRSGMSYRDALDAVLEEGEA